MSLLPFFEWSEHSAVGETIRNSLWLFPVIESFHLLALVLIGGCILVVDLRLCGFGLRHQPVAQVALDTQSWLIGGLVVMVASGILLFTSEAIKCYYHAAFWVKMTSLLMALIFTFTVRRQSDDGRECRSTPRQAGSVDFRRAMVGRRHRRTLDRILLDPQYRSPPGWWRRVFSVSSPLLAVIDGRLSAHAILLHTG